MGPGKRYPFKWVIHLERFDDVFWSMAWRSSPETGTSNLVWIMCVAMLSGHRWASSWTDPPSPRYPRWFFWQPSLQTNACVNMQYCTANMSNMGTHGVLSTFNVKLVYPFEQFTDWWHPSHSCHWRLANRVKVKFSHSRYRALDQELRPGADPGVQAVSPQVMWSESRHRPSSRLPLLSARPAVTSVAFIRWRYL